jgi:hypothetical protein
MDDASFSESRRQRRAVRTGRCSVPVKGDAMNSRSVARLVVAVMVVWMAGGAVAQELALDGVPFTGNAPPPMVAAERLEQGAAGLSGGEISPVVDTVGSIGNSSSDTGRAKGNAYRVDLSTGLIQAEFWLDFSDTQTLAFYVYQSTVEFGTYTQVFTSSSTVTGTGDDWYSSGPTYYRLEAGNFYIIAVSWSGTLTYYYGNGESQPVSFGEHVHGYAVGYHPLPGTFDSLSNDFAIYLQRLTTDVDVIPVELQSFSVE